MNNRLRLLAALAAGVPLLVLAAERLAARTGLWESTTTMKMSGLAIPADAMANMPPAQRAQMEQMMKQMGIGAPRTTTSKSCVTEDDLNGEAFRREMEGDPEMKCDYKQVTATSRRQEWTFQCKSPGGAATGKMAFEVEDSTRVRGTMEMRSPQGNVDVQYEGRWLQADCAGVD